MKRIAQKEGEWLMNATEANPVFSRDQLTEAVEKTFDDILDAWLERKNFVVYQRNENGLTANDCRYLKGKGYNVECAYRIQPINGIACRVLQVTISWKNNKENN